MTNKKAHTIISFNNRDDLADIIGDMEFDWNNIAVIFQATQENVELCKLLYKWK